MVATPFTTESVCELEPLLELWVHDRGDPVTIAIAGQLDGATARHVRDVIAELHAAGHPHVEVDLSRIGFADGDGLAVLAGAAHGLDRAGRSLRLVRPSGPVQHVGECTGLDHAIS
jgi:anti-anti-sigma factor